MAGPFVRTDPALTAAGTLYVSTTGNDGNSGLSWDEAFATIQGAVNALPANGGLVEVGYGDFAGFSMLLSGQYGVRVRGRGIGSPYSSWLGSSSISPTANPTRIVNSTSAAVAVKVTGQTSGSFNSPSGLILEDIAVVGAAGTSHGISIVGCPWLELRRVAVFNNGGSGIVIANSWDVKLDTVVSVGNTLHGLDLSTGLNVNAFVASNCIFDSNTQNGAQLGAGNAITCINCDFSSNGKNGCVGSNGGPYKLMGCFFYDNSTSANGSYSGFLGSGGQYFIDSGYFSGNAVQGYGITSGTGDFYVLQDCTFLGHVHWSFDNFNEGKFEARNSNFNVGGADSIFNTYFNINGDSGNGPQISGAVANGKVLTNVLSQQPIWVHVGSANAASSVTNASFATSGTAINLFKLPAGAIIHAIRLNTTTGFNGTTQSIEVGIVGSAAKYLPLTLVTSTGTTDNFLSTPALESISAATQITATSTWTGSPTTGVADIYALISKPI